MLHSLFLTKDVSLMIRIINDTFTLLQFKKEKTLDSCLRFCNVYDYASLETTSFPSYEPHSGQT